MARTAWERIRSVLVVVLLLTTAAVAFVQSYQKWLDPIIDAGRDLYIPGELLRGEKLYRDILYAFHYPPLTPYLLAGGNLLVGRSLAAYTVMGLAMSAVVSLLLWRIGRMVGGWEVGVASPFLFLALSFTGASSWGCNFIFPYAHAATIGMMFVLLLVAGLVSPLAVRGRVPFYALMGGLLAAWTKIEFALLVLVVLLVLSLFAGLSRRVLVVFLIVGAISFAAVSILFRDTPPGQQWLPDQVLPQTLLGGETGRSFYSAVAGTADLLPNLSQIALSALLMLLAVSALAWLEPRLARSSKGARIGLESLFVGVTAFALTFGAPDALFRSLAVFQLLLLPVAWRHRRSPLFVLLIVSLLSTWRIYLHLSPRWYGFFLAVPCYLLIPYVLIRFLPEQRLYSRRSGLLWLPVLFLVGVDGLLEQRQMYALKRFPIDTPQGTLLDANPDRAAILTQAVDFLRRSGGTLVVMPEGLTLNYFTGMRNPTPFHTFTPVELDSKAERRAIEALRARPPDWVVVLTRDVSEFGSRGFGVDYGLDLASYLRSAYRPERRWSSPRFHLLLLRRAVSSQ